MLVFFCSISAHGQTSEITAFLSGNVAYRITSEIDKTVSVSNYYQMDVSIQANGGIDVIPQSAPRRVLGSTIVSVNHTYTGNVVIASSVVHDGKTYTVTAIDVDAFKNKDNFTGITIPGTINTIEEGTFGSCSDLKTLSFLQGNSPLLVNNAYYTTGNYNPKPDSLYLDRDFVLKENAKGHGAYFPEYATFSKIKLGEHLTTIHPYMFSGFKMNSIVIPKNITSIGHHAFYLCDTNLTSVTFEGSYPEIPENAFYLCSKLTNIKLPQGLKTIKANAFNGCSSLKQFTFPGTVEAVEDDAFKNCTGLKTLSFLYGETPLSIHGNSTFSYSGSVSPSPDSLYLDRDLALIEDVRSSGRYLPTSFTRVKLGEHLTTIHPYMFYYCKIDSVEFTKSITSIGANSFYDCNQLTSVIAYWDKPLQINENTFSANTYSNAKLSVPRHKSEIYGQSIGWKNFKNMVEMKGIPVEQSLALSSLPQMTYGDAAYLLPSTTTEEQPLTWTSSDSQVAAINGNRLTIKKAGSVTITATQEGNEDYLPFSRKLELSINKAVLKIIANNCTKTQGEENPELTISYEGFKYDDNAQSLTKQPVVSTTATTNSPAGSYPITVSGAQSDNYTFTYVEGILTIAEKPLTVNEIYPTETTIHVGESERMSIHLDNEDAIIMFEFYMQLPDGLNISVDEDEYLDAILNSTRSDRTHSLEVEKGSDGLYHFLCYSSKNKPFIGNSGELLNIGITCDNGVAEGVYQGVIKNILMSDQNKNAIEPADVTFNIEVVDYILGDLSGDRRINGMDIVEMVTLVMDQSYMRAADLYPVNNPDGIINGMDLVQEVELVMSQSASGNAPAISSMPEKQLTVSKGVPGVRTLGINAYEQFTLAQMTVEISNGMTLTDVTSDKNHTVAYKHLDGNKYIVVCYSNENAAFDSNANALSFHYTGDGEMAVSNILLVDTDKKEYRGTDVQSGIPTDINNISTYGHSFDIYTPDGRMVKRGVTSTEGLTKGVYIIDNQKVMIK